MTLEMTPYDQKAWAEVERWRKRRLEKDVRNRLPKPLRDRATSATNSAKSAMDSVPGVAQFEELLMKALSGLTDMASRASAASVRKKAVIAAFQKKGHDVNDLNDVHALSLREIEKVKPNLTLAYGGASAVEGAAAGAAVSGGELVATVGTVFGAGAGAAPGAGTIVGAMAADAAAVLIAANRSVAHVATYYGYDVNEPDERLFALGVLSVGTAAAGSSKAAAYIELNKLVQMLARRATWSQLRQNVVTTVVEKVFARLGLRLTQRKLGQAVPVVGILLGSGMNASMIASVVDDAEHIYRERFLRERYGLDQPEEYTDPQSRAPGDEAEIVSVAEIIDDELDKPDNGQAHELEGSVGEGRRPELERKQTMADDTPSDEG